MTETAGNAAPKKRVAVMWTHLSGYLNACLKELAQTDGVELFVSNIRTADDAPYSEDLFSWMGNRYQWERNPDNEELLSRLVQFRPDIILSSGWNIPGHRYVLRKFRNKAIRIVALDNPWRGTPKQWLGILAARFYLHPLCDALFVPGERQAVFAHKLGFPQKRILRGALSCDHKKFSAVFSMREQSGTDSRSFVYVGRLSPEKGLGILVEAYRQYRQSASDPWPLRCYGAGPMKDILAREEGIEMKGFCQPDDLPGVLLHGGCLILPSTFEPWALVLHEAAATGMAIICSDAVGASVHMVQDGYNGYIVETGDATELSGAISRYAGLNASERREMGENSYRLSLQFTPEKWAKYLLSKSDELVRSAQ